MFYLNTLTSNQVVETQSSLNLLIISLRWSVPYAACVKLEISTLPYLKTNKLPNNVFQILLVSCSVYVPDFISSVWFYSKSASFCVLFPTLNSILNTRRLPRPLFSPQFHRCTLYPVLGILQLYNTCKLLGPMNSL